VQAIVKEVGRIAAKEGQKMIEKRWLESIGLEKLRDSALRMMLSSGAAASPASEKKAKVFSDSKGSSEDDIASQDDDVNERARKKTKVEPRKVAALAAKVENASEDPSKDSITPVKQVADPALSPSAHAKQSESAGDCRVTVSQHQSKPAHFPPPRHQKRKLDRLEGPTRSSDTPGNHAAAAAAAVAAAAAKKLEQADMEEEWGCLECGDGTVVSLNFPVGAPFVIGHTQVEGVDSTCDFEVVDSWKNPKGTQVILSLYLIVHMIYYCYSGF